MTNHLPECHTAMIPDFHNERWICICAALRACEQRVLTAAREAVDRVASDMANWSSAETKAATSAIPDLSVDQWVWAQRGMHRAIAAIDALRDKP